MSTSLPLVRSELLDGLPWLRHGITTRVRGMGLADGNVGYTAPRNIADGWDMRRRWTEAVGLDPERIVRVHQVHGSAVAVANVADGLRGGRPDAVGAPIADAIVTATPGLALMTLHADCLPILLADTRRPAVATIHAGWRGTLADICGATVRTMADAFDTEAADLVAFIGPGIGVDAFQVGDDVAEIFTRDWPHADAVSRRSGRALLDLKRVNTWQLAVAGVLSDRIETSPLCTVADGAMLFSHRAQGPDTGRFAAIIGIAAEGGRS